MPTLPKEHLGKLLDYFSTYLSVTVHAHYTTNDITKLVSKSTYKLCTLYPIPIHLLEAKLSSVAPVIADIVNVSIAKGVFPSAFEKALVTPLMKKTMLDANDVNNYRPVSNLCVASKIVGKVVALHFSEHWSHNDLYEHMQSAYCKNHSTETASVCVPVRARVRLFMCCDMFYLCVGALLLLHWCVCVHLG